jgi:carbon-monoxide dehydrogenase large subunit
MAVTSMIGARIQRREDPKLITGHGHFVDDVNLVNMAHMSIVRSPYAHARIRSLDTSAAKAANPRATPSHQLVCRRQEAGA